MKDKAKKRDDTKAGERALKLIGYARVSTDNQANEGTIELQIKALKEYAAINGHELKGIYEDNGVSGGLRDRAGLAILFECLDNDATIEGVLIFKLDRLARDIMIQENLIKDFAKRGKRIISTLEPDLDSKDATRKFIRQILGCVSEYEKDIIVMRLSNGRGNKARKGMYAGGQIPFGYKLVDGKFQQIEEINVVKEIFALKEQGNKVKKIVEELTKMGIKPPKGGETWHDNTVRRILKNPVYGGQYHYSGYLVDVPEYSIKEIE